jgi:hypothetical protein
MTSAVFLERDGVTYALIAFSGGKSILKPVLQDRRPDRGARLVTWPTHYVAINFSLCPETDMFFVSAPGTSLQIFRTAELFKSDPARHAEVPCFEGSSGELRFCCTFPGCDSVMFFVRPATNALYSMEVTSTAVNVARFPTMDRFVFFDQMLEIYAWVRTDREFLVIGADGAVYSATPFVEDLSFEYRVPPSFWATAHRVGRDICEITGTDPSQNYNTLFTGDVAYFHPPVPTKTLTFHIREPTLAIVGIVLSFGPNGDEHRPARIVVNGRSCATKRDRIYMFPLKPSEVRPGRSVTLLFPDRVEHDIVIQNAVVFAMPFERIRRFLTVDRKVPNALLDVPDHSRGRDAVGAAWRIVDAVAPVVDAVAPVVDADVTPAVVRDLVRIVYGGGGFAGPARAGIVRAAAANTDVVRLWAEGLRAAITDGVVVAWDDVWRDVALFPADEQSALQALAWTATPEIASVNAAVAAFVYPVQ